MWIIPRNYRLSSRFAPAMVESKEDLSLPGLNIESSLMWRSKPSQLRTWLQRWKRGGYIRPLFGRILKPFRWSAFEAGLMSSLAVIRVSHSAQRDSEKEKTTQDTSGLTFPTSLRQLSLFDVSLKTSKDTSLSDSEKSLATWKALVIVRRGEYSQRVKSAHRIRESGSLLWPTVTTDSASSRTKKYSQGGMPLSMAVRDWATPNTMDHLPQRSEEAVNTWPTPLAGAGQSSSRRDLPAELADSLGMRELQQERGLENIGGRAAHSSQQLADSFGKRRCSGYSERKDAANAWESPRCKELRGMGH